MDKGTLVVNRRSYTGETILEFTSAEYEKVKDFIPDGTKYVITDDTRVGTNVDKFEHYSTEEKRIGTWTDGKPLYRKTYIIHLQESHTGSLSNISVIIPHNILINDVARIYGAYNGSQKMPLGFSQGGVYVMCRIIGTDIQVDYSQHPIFNNAIVYANIEYTKTTD